MKRNKGQLAKRVALIVAGLYLAVCLLPFVVVGESWGMVWVYLAWPLSESWLKDVLWDYGIGVLVVVVSLINAAVLYLAVWWIGLGMGSVWGQLKPRREP